jgi:Putative transposase
LWPPIAQYRLLPAKDGLVRITLKRAFSDGTLAIDLDPLSLLSRLAAAVPYPRLHTVRYSGVLAPASKLRAEIAPTKEPIAAEGEAECVNSAIACGMPDELPKPGPYRPWAALVKRTFHVDVLQCPNCQGRMRLLAMLTEGAEVRRYLRAISEPTELPAQAPASAPPH